MDQQELVERVIQQIEKNIEAGKQAWESPEVQEKVESLRDVIRKYLTEYPVSTLAVSVAAGYVLAKVCRSKKSRKRDEE